MRSFLTASVSSDRATNHRRLALLASDSFDHRRKLLEELNFLGLALGQDENRLEDVHRAKFLRLDLKTNFFEQRFIETVDRL